MGRHARRAFLSVVVALLMGSCGSQNADGPSSGGAAAPRPSESPSPSTGVTNLEDNGELDLGTYRASLFRPPFEFSIAEPGWYAGHPTAWFQPMNVYPEHPEWYLIFFRVDQVYDPTARKPDAVRAPQDLVRWLQHHPQFTMTRPKGTTIGGLRFLTFEADVTKPLSTCTDEGTDVPCALIAPIEGDAPLRYRKGAHLRMYVGESGGRPLLISIEAPEDEFETFVVRAEEILDSVEFR